MPPNRARVLLSLRLVRFLGAFAVMSSSCLIPPDGTPIEVSSNFPPEIEVDTTPVLVQPVDEGNEQCAFTLSVTVHERDSCLVDIRLIADNQRNIINGVFEDFDVRLAPRIGNDASCPAPPYKARIKIPVDTSQFSSPLVGAPHTLSLFVKDTTDDWATAWELIGSDRDKLDGGALLPVTPDHPRDGQVVSYNWTVAFEQRTCH